MGKSEASLSLELCLTQALRLALQRAAKSTPTEQQAL
jgi:hypothetical protein